MSSNANHVSSQDEVIRPISTLLIANRGEIAVRVIRTAIDMGIQTVAVYSDADANALHVKSAHIAVRIGPAEPGLSYLNIAAVIEAAKKSGADAIHPGYGFLSENPEFAEACEAAGIIFIGPDAQAMRAMGLKDAAKALMEKAGVPVVPGFHGDNQDAAFLAEQAAKIGYPILIKARAGGGGKGMRKVDLPEQFPAALEAAQREGLSSFADSAVLIEKYIEHPRHIEVQIFGDRYGQCVHMFERDCSLQRRHQKVIEEAPAPNMTDELRDAMTKAAIRTAESINYVGAGTVEFIVDASGPLRADGFWFMEMNTRLQVEHPVTEAVTGIDLVQWQLLIASGHRLPLLQTDIKLQGHSVEARLYAEDVSAGFLPATGTLHRFALCDQSGRVDTGVVEGDVVQPYYDPMLAKLISYAPDRASAFRKLQFLLDKSVVMGVTTNRAFLAALCAHDDVLSGLVHTHYIEQNTQVNLADTHASSTVTLDANAALAAVICAGQPALALESGEQSRSVFYDLGVWQLWRQPDRLVTLLVNQQPLMLRVVRLNSTDWLVTQNSVATVPIGDEDKHTDAITNRAGITLSVANLQMLDSGATIKVDGRDFNATGINLIDAVYCRVGPSEAQFKKVVIEHAEAGIQGALHLLAPMPGRIISLQCQAGDDVAKGDVLMTLEAMKMEHSLVAVADTRVDSVLVKENDQVEQGMRLAVFTDNSA